LAEAPVGEAFDRLGTLLNPLANPVWLAEPRYIPFSA